MDVFRKRIDDLKFQLSQSFWECSPRCCSTRPVLLRKEVKEGIEGWREIAMEERRGIGITVVRLDCHLLHLAGGLQAQGETLREGASGNPTGVAEKGLKVSLLYTQSFSSYSLRMFEAGKDVCWPVTWEMVAPELGEVRSFILQNNFTSLQCHFQQLFCKTILLPFDVTFSNWWNSSYTNGGCS